MFILFALALTILLGCGEKEPIKLGFIAGTSGKVADLGISGRDAVEMMVEQCNRNGGINGRRIELLIKDDQQDPEIAKKSVQKLIESGVVAIIGPMTSDMSMAITPLLNKAQVLAVSPTTSTQHLSGQDDFFFRVCSTTLDNARRNAAYHIKTKDMQRIVAVYDMTNRFYCENWLKNFKKYFVGNGREVLTAMGFDRQPKQSFTEITHEMLALQPDGILIVANSMDSAMICQQIRKVDANIPITLSDWGATERLLELGGKAVEGVTLVQLFDRNNPEQKYQEFRKAYLDRFKREPGYAGAFACDAVQVVLTALEKQKSGQTLKASILLIRRFQGLQKDFSFDEFGDVDRANLSIAMVRNRKFVVLE